MATEDKPVYEQVNDLLTAWNKPAEDNSMERLIGVSAPEGDTRATASVRPEEMSHPRNPGDDSVDAERMMQDDGDDEDESVEEDSEKSYDDMTKSELQDVIDARNEGRDEDSKIARTGKNAELVARLEADDESADEDDDDEE